MIRDTPTLRDRAEYALLRVFLAVALRLPYAMRLRLAGWLNAHVLVPLAGVRPKMRRNLELAFPEMPDAEVRRVMHAVSDHLARTMMEIFSGDEFRAVAARAQVIGEEGRVALESAYAEGRGVILVSGHFGNYDVGRAHYLQRGYRIGGLFRYMDNPLFNRLYLDAIDRIGKPMFPRTRRGMAEMVRFLRSGGITGLLIDQRHGDGAALSFFGHEALTPLSAAELALKYEAVLIPAYGLRRPDGLSFDILLEPPIAPGTPEQMTQAINDSLEAVVRKHPEQWLWMHDRWGVRRAEKRAHKRWLKHGDGAKRRKKSAKT